MLQLSNQSRRYFQLLFFIFVLSPSLVFTGCSGGGGSSKNNSSTPKIVGAVLKAANLVAASSASGDSVVLEWLPGEGKDLSYDVHLSKVKNFTPDANTKKLTTKADSATINNLESNTTYYAMIVTNSATGSKPSLQLPVTTSDVVAELNTSLTLKDVEPTAVTDNNITTSEDVKSGEIIYATSGEPYLRKAVAVNKDAQGKNIVTTEPVHIRDVYQDLSFSTSVKLVDIDAPVKSAPSIGYVNAATMIPNSNSTYDQQIVRTWDTGLTMTSNRNVKKTALRAKRLAVAIAAPSPSPSTAKKIEDSEKYYSGNVVASIVATIGKDVNTPINLLRRNQSVTYEFDGSFGESDSERASKKELCEKNGGTFWYDEDGDDGAFNVGYDSKCQNMPVQMCKVEASADVTHPSSLNDSNLPSVVVNNNQPYISWNPIPENIDYEEGSPYTMDIDVDITPGVFCGTEYEDTYSEETIDLNDITLVAGDTLLSKSVGLTDEEKNVVFDEDGFKLENVFTADYSPTVEFKAKIERATLKEAKAKLNSTLHLGDTIKLNAETSGSHTFPIKPIYTKKFVKVISAGPVPIVIVGRLRLLAIAELESSGKIEATVNLDSTLEMDLGVVYDPDTKTWKPTKHKDFTYEVKAGGKGDVEATVKIRIVPTLELSLYDAAAAQFLVEPYVYSKVGVEGEINVGLGNVSGSYVDITAQFTSLEAGIGMDGKVYVGPAWDSSDDIGLTWPSDAVYAPSKLPLKDASFLNPKQIKYVEEYYEATGTYKQFALISETPVLGIPKLSYNFNLDAIPPKDINTRAIQIEAKCEPMSNPLYPTLGKKVYINCSEWKSENITNNFTMIEGDGNNTLGIFWLVPNETNGKYGNDKFRLVNNSSLGWARQYISSEYEYIGDADTIPEYWSKRYSPNAPMSNDDDLDNDGYTNLQEYRNGTNPIVPDGEAVTQDTTPPTFISENNVTVAENQISAITLKADDQTRISYSISGGDSTAFDLNATTGEVTFKTAPDYETKKVYTFTATATDAMSNSSTQSVTINISDVDESVPDTTPPTFTSSSEVSVEENQLNAITLQATDESNITYSISGGDSTAFNIDTASGVVTFKSAPDYETKNLYTFTAKASDGTNVATQEITIHITDIDESEPNKAPVAKATVSSDSISEGESVTFDASQSNDSDGEIVSYKWSEGAVLLSSDISFTKADFSVGTHTISLAVTDDDNATATATVTVAVSANSDTTSLSDKMLYWEDYFDSAYVDGKQYKHRLLLTLYQDNSCRLTDFNLDIDEQNQDKKDSNSNSNQTYVPDDALSSHACDWSVTDTELLLAFNEGDVKITLNNGSLKVGDPINQCITQSGCKVEELFDVEHLNKDAVENHELKIYGTDGSITHWYLYDDATMQVFEDANTTAAFSGSWSANSNYIDIRNENGDLVFRADNSHDYFSGNYIDLAYYKGYLSRILSATKKKEVSTIKKTGQIRSYTDYDDGYYQKGATPSYTRASDIVTDELTGLMWQDDAAAASVTKQWLTDENYNTCSNDTSSPACYDTSGDTAATYCSELTLGGYTDWRLPTSTELEGIVDYGRYYPSIDTTYFNNVSSNRYWSSTTLEGNKLYAWIVRFNYGPVVNNNKDVNYYVRCVRDGE